jgi:hypothetical protein
MLGVDAYSFSQKSYEHTATNTVWREKAWFIVLNVAPKIPTMLRHVFNVARPYTR